jgi:hypothetical protein
MRAVTSAVMVAVTMKRWFASMGCGNLHQSNRFSLLLDRKAKPKGANVASPIQAVVPVDKNPVVRPVAVPDTTANAGFLVAEQYVQLRVPIDVAYQVAVDYLIGRHDKPGVLVVGNFDETKERFRPLLCVLGRHWPGFLSALLIACVDVVCRWAELDQNAKRSPPSSQCNYDAYGETLVLWIRHLLSRKLLSKIHNWKGKKSGDASVDRCGVDGMASLPVLQTMQFPLNRLCDRVVQANAKQDTRPNKLMTASSAQLVDLFCQILGPHRIENYGAGVGSGGDMDEQWQEPVLFVQPSKVAAPSRLVETDSAAPVSTSLSLEDMEAMLLMTGDSITKAACPTKSQDGHAKINSTLTSPGAIRWVQCQTWEPCAIGCLL